VSAAGQSDWSANRIDVFRNLKQANLRNGAVGVAAELDYLIADLTQVVEYFRSSDLNLSQHSPTLIIAARAQQKRLPDQSTLGRAGLPDIASVKNVSYSCLHHSHPSRLSHVQSANGRR